MQSPLGQAGRPWPRSAIAPPECWDLRPSEGVRAVTLPRAGWRHADPPLARLSARRHRLQRLHAAARARLDAGGPRRHGVQPGAAARGVRPGWGERRTPRRRRAAAGVRARSLRGVRRQARWGLPHRRAGALGGGERPGCPRAPAGRRRVLQPRPPRGPGRRGERRALRGEGPRLRARVRDAGQRRPGGVGERLPAAGRGHLRRLRPHPPRARRRVRPRRQRSRGPAGRRHRRLAAAGAGDGARCPPGRGGARPTERRQRRGAPARRGERGAPRRIPRRRSRRRSSISGS